MRKIGVATGALMAILLVGCASDAPEQADPSQIADALETASSAVETDTPSAHDHGRHTSVGVVGAIPAVRVERIRVGDDRIRREGGNKGGKKTGCHGEALSHFTQLLSFDTATSGARQAPWHPLAAPQKAAATKSFPRPAAPR